VLLGPGTYWLALSNALASPTNTDPIFWDMGYGPSTAFDTVDVSPLNPNGSLANWDIPGTGSETFDIRGTEQEMEGTPEPGTAALLGAGLLLAGILRRRFV
jgi:hypothetical protein